MGRKKWLFVIAGIFSGLANGFFGGGGGAIALITFKMMPQMSVHDAHAMCVATMLPVSVVSAVMYVLHGSLPEWPVVFQTMAGTLIGGMLGARLLPKIKTIWISRIFAAFVIVSALRMIF